MGTAQVADVKATIQETQGDDFNKDALNIIYQGKASRAPQPWDEQPHKCTCEPALMGACKCCGWCRYSRMTPP
jgi:hypothetical protein